MSAIHADGHVHIYPHFDRARLFAAAARVATEHAAPLLLLLAESRGYDAFLELAREATPTAEPQSLVVSDSVFVVAGRQLRSREGLEVLAIGLEPDHPLYARRDGESSAEALVEAGLHAGAITVLPWGFGKWLGRRGAEVRRLADREALRGHALFFLGDIPARCRPWPRPSAFARHRVLPGTDLLPLARSETGVARYGFRVHGTFDRARPLGSLIRVFRGDGPVEPIGDRDGPLTTLRDQLRYRWRR